MSTQSFIYMFNTILFINVVVALCPAEDSCARRRGPPRNQGAVKCACELGYPENKKKNSFKSSSLEAKTFARLKSTKQD